eukprot:CFRG6896T1
MWSLQPQNGTGTVYHITARKRTWTVGRQVGIADILIGGADRTVGRHHCQLLLEAISSADDRDYRNDIFVSDPSYKGSELVASKSGTFVNDVRVDGKVKLSHGDVLKIGINDSLFRVICIPIVICMSNVKPKSDLRLSLQETMRHIGGRIEKAVTTEVTHVVSPEIQVTEKIIRALLLQAHLVKPAWLIDLSALLCDAKLPDPILYLPGIQKEERKRVPLDCSFARRVERRTLFQGCLFIFGSAQAKDADFVRLGGGKVGKPLRDATRSEMEAMANDECVRFISDGNRISGKLLLIKTKIEKSGWRVIPSHEITRAIISCNTSRYCNPAVSGSLEGSDTLTASRPYHVNTVARSTELDLSVEKQESECKNDALVPTHMHIDKATSVSKSTILDNQEKQTNSQVVRTNNEQKDREDELVQIDDLGPPHSEIGSTAMDSRSIKSPVAHTCTDISPNESANSTNTSKHTSASTKQATSTKLVRQGKGVLDLLDITSTLSQPAPAEVTHVKLESKLQKHTLNESDEFSYSKSDLMTTFAPRDDSPRPFMENFPSLPPPSSPDHGRRKRKIEQPSKNLSIDDRDIRKHILEDADVAGEETEYTLPSDCVVTEIMPTERRELSFKNTFSVWDKVVNGKKIINGQKTFKKQFVAQNKRSVATLKIYNEDGDHDDMEDAHTGQVHSSSSPTQSQSPSLRSSVPTNAYTNDIRVDGGNNGTDSGDQPWAIDPSVSGIPDNHSRSNPITGRRRVTNMTKQKTITRMTNTAQGDRQGAKRNPFKRR